MKPDELLFRLEQASNNLLVREEEEIRKSR